MMSTTSLPPIPAGHKLVCRVNDYKGGYWLALDDKGYEYVVGACVEESGDAMRVTTRTADGDRREWVRNGAVWARLDAGGATDAYRSQHRFSAGLSAWSLPSGLPATETEGVRSLKRLAGKLADRTVSAGAWIEGPPGSGKTLGAHWIALHCTQYRMQVCHTSTADMLRSLRASYTNEPGAVLAWQRLQAHAEAADLLILDDVGAEPAGDDFRAELLRIVDCRQNASMPIVATSNLHLDSLHLPPPSGCSMDARLASRFGRLRAMSLGSTDHRRAR